MALKLVVQQGSAIRADVKAIIEDWAYWAVRHLLQAVVLCFEAVPLSNAATRIVVCQVSGQVSPLQLSSFHCSRTWYRWTS